MQRRSAGFGTAAALWWVNFERPALADPLVRRAVSLAIDQESIAGLVAPAGSGSVADLLLPEALVSCPSVTAPGYDTAQARDLLKEAGYVGTDGDGYVDKDGQPLEIVIGGYPQRFQRPLSPKEEERWELASLVEPHTRRSDSSAMQQDAQPFIAYNARS